MKGLIDPKAELGRLQKDFDKVQKHDQIAGKLSNERFCGESTCWNITVEGEKVKLARSLQIS